MSDRITLTLKDQGDAATADVRLRQALKTLLRAFGFRCTGISSSDPAASGPMSAAEAEIVLEAFDAPACEPAATAGHRGGTSRVLSGCRTRSREGRRNDFHT